MTVGDILRVDTSFIMKTSKLLQGFVKLFKFYIKTCLFKSLILSYSNSSPVYMSSISFTHLFGSHSNPTFIYCQGFHILDEYLDESRHREARSSSQVTQLSTQLPASSLALAATLPPWSAGMTLHTDVPRM